MTFCLCLWKHKQEEQSAALLSLCHVGRPSKQCSCEWVSEVSVDTWLRVLLVTTPPKQGKDISVL